jgi:site-specific DNA-methyltransferase (cytosine-N4-specific)
MKFSPSYTTKYGKAFCCDSRKLLEELDDNSISLVVTSPPFSLLRKKEYGNKEQSEYVEWLGTFAEVVYRKLKSDGSFVVDLGGAYRKGYPVRSLYNFRVPIYFCDKLNFFLAEDFYWFNPSKLPSPIEWVNKRKIRAKDSVNPVWWFSKSEFPKADVTKVLTEYSERMKKLLEDPDKFYTPKKRPSGHDIGKGFGKGNEGAIPSNLLQISNSESNGTYMAYCKELDEGRHPARFPAKLPEFFIKMLTDHDDLVVDIFAGSNTTGCVCERLKRNWISVDIEMDYIAPSSFRFIRKDMPIDKVKEIVSIIRDQKTVSLEKYAEPQ